VCGWVCVGFTPCATRSHPVGWPHQHSLTPTHCHTTHMDTTTSIHACRYLSAGVRDILVVLDNVPYAFVAPKNRFYCGFGLGSAPDDPVEFATFVESFVNHLAERYTPAVCSPILSPSAPCMKFTALRASVS